MRKCTIVGVAVLAMSWAPLAAQQPTLSPEHALLKEMAGAWNVTATGPTTAAGQAGPSVQQETSELVCGGFWLETVTRSGNSEMFWLTGFDPGPHRFVRLRVAGRAEPVLEDGEFDAEHRTITWRGRSALARRIGMQDVVTLRVGEARVDRTVRVAGGDQPLIERVFAPAKQDGRGVPKREQPKAPAPEYELLAQFAGDWECALLATMPGMEKPMRSTGRMREELVGDGCWLRSSFESEFGGSKIEGRGLLGFDRKQMRYVRYWADSGSPVLAISSSALDPTGKKLIGTGTTLMPRGEVTIEEEVELGSDLRRVVQRLRTSEGKDAGSFEMVMTRRPPQKAK